MNTKTIMILQIGIAILFAGAIILTSSLLDNSGHSQTAMFLLIAVWFVPFTYLLKVENRNRKAKCN